MVIYQDRGYQTRIEVEIRAAIAAGYRRIMVQLPTGAGKTVLAARLISVSCNRGLRTWFNVHRRELIDQASRTFSDFSIPHGYVAPDYPFLPLRHLQVNSIPSLASKDKHRRLRKPDVMWWDEAHHCTAASWSKIMQAYPDVIHIGLSATPQRLDGKGLDEHFDFLITGPTVAELIADGHLNDYRLFAPGGGIDMSGVGMVAGDYNKKQRRAVVDRPSITGDVVRHYKDLAMGTKFLAFGVSVEHSINMVRAFRAAGIPCVHVDGETKRDERNGAIEDLKAGHLLGLVNVGLFGEGFDIPAGQSRPIQTVIDVCPSRSLTRVLQGWGRGLRPQRDGTISTILDHAGNCTRHGLPDDDREWTLKGRPKKTKANTDVPVRICPECFGAVPAGTRVCPLCDTEIPITAREVEIKKGKLAEVDKKKLRRQRIMEQANCESLDDLIALGRSRGYPHAEGWARNVWRNRKKTGSGFAARNNARG